MQVEFEGGRDAEVGAGPAQAPEQFRVLVAAGRDVAAVGGHQLDRAKVVDGQAEPPLKPAHAATQRQAGDAGVADHADRAYQAVRLRRLVELAQQRAAVCPRRARSPDRRSRRASATGR